MDESETTRVYHQHLSQDQPVRIVLFGMPCAFTEPVLDALLGEPGIDLVAVVLPGSEVCSPITTTARNREVPVIQVTDRSCLDHGNLRVALETIAPDLIVTACFPWRFPVWLLDLPLRGCLNIHPSLLPDGRGPEPAFWAFRWGLPETGVTVHVMDTGFDTGPILAQSTMTIPEEATLPALEQELAIEGARLLIEHLPAVIAGTAVTRPQPARTSRYARLPVATDLEISTSWAAADAARFLRAVIPVYGSVPILVLATGQRLVVVEVMGTAVALPGEESLRREGTQVAIRFATGTLICRVAEDRQPLHLHRR